MSQQDIIAETDSRMEKSAEALSRELASIRSGRASPALVENLIVEYYGAPTSLKQIASISAPELRILMIQPWDKQSIADVERGILKADLGLVPNSDGDVIRITIPPLTEERRRDLVRLVGRKAEEANVAVRNIRRDGLTLLRDMEKQKSLSKDEGRRGQEQLQKLTDSYIEQMDGLRKEKEIEVMEV